MSDFDPGTGWREVERPVAAVAPEAVSHRKDHIVRTWIPKEPMRPLPTEQYTVIRVAWAGASSAGIRCLVDGRWQPVTPGGTMDPEILVTRITDWELLAEPCNEHYGAEDLKRVERDTARAVLADLMAGKGIFSKRLDDIATKYGFTL